MLRYEHGGDVFSHKNILLDYSVNLNPFGMPKQVKDAIVSHIDEYEAYPDTKCRALTKAIAEREGLEEWQVLCGNGAADLIYRLCLSRKPQRMLTLAPTFSEYEKAARLCGSEIEYHRLSEADNFEVTEGVLSAIGPQIDMMFLCNPNNPTGRMTDPDLLERIVRRCDETGTFLVVDECFLTFSDGKSLVPLLREMPNLAVLKAFTKMYAMAGLRLGYLLSGSREALLAAEEHAQCWSVSAVAQTAGLAALQCEGWEEHVRQTVIKERNYLSRCLRGLGITVFDSDTNYIFIRSDRPLYEALLEKGVMIRRCENYEGLDARYYRLGIKLRPQNNILLRALEEVLHG